MCPRRCSLRAWLCAPCTLAGSPSSDACRLPAALAVHHVTSMFRSLPLKYAGPSRVTREPSMGSRRKRGRGFVGRALAAICAAGVASHKYKKARESPGDFARGTRYQKTKPKIQKYKIQKLQKNEKYKHVKIRENTA